MDVNQLHRIAKAFREAFETVGRKTDFGFLPGFPVGCCTWASEFIGNFLIDEYGFTPERVFGTISDGNHEWTELNQIVIDITADQFGQDSLIVSRQSLWHSGLEDRKTCAYTSISKYGRLHNGEKVLDLYNKIADIVRKYGQ